MESELFKDITEDMKENERGKEEEKKKNSSRSGMGVGELLDLEGDLKE